MKTNSVSPDVLASTSNFKAILENSELNNCDREPIHTPNLIQPHGVLLAVSADEYHILQASLNTKTMLGMEVEELLNEPLQNLLGIEQVRAIQDCLAENFDNINPIPIEIAQDKAVLYFNAIVHRHREIVIIELEPRPQKTAKDFFHFYRLVKNPINKLQNTDNLDQLCDAIATEVKQITEFDRVMVYRFDVDGAGVVIAEARDEGLTPYLGLHYPATDIPQQARRLFARKSLRLIPDVAYEPVAIVPELNPLTKELLDMSLAELRSVSPFHIEYLNNMEVSATLVISLIKDKQLWGLISCHHNAPKKIPYEIRTACELIGQIASFELKAKEDKQDLDYKMKLQSMQSQFIETISTAKDLKRSLVDNSQYLLDLVDAEGVALFLENDLTLLGNTPDSDFLTELLPWLETKFEGNRIYETNSLGQVYPPAKQYKATASGLLALLISKVQKTFIVWFRPEVVQTVNWAGNPNQPVGRDEAGILLLSPRTSFELWKETVRGKSVPWKSCELESASELRSSIVSIVLAKADELTQINKELARSNAELDSFAYIASHDLKEPLRGIYNYSSFLLEDYSAILDESGIDKLNTLMLLAHRMEDLINSLLHYSRLGRAQLQLRLVDINDLVAGVLDVISASARDTKVEFKIPRSLPTIKCDRTQVNELFTNLISNGIKYNNKSEKTIEIGYLDPQDPVHIAKMSEYPDGTTPKTIFYVKDNGIGMRERHIESIFRIFKRLHGQKKYGGGTGAGLTIAKKIVQRHGGEIWVKSIYKEGSTFYFTLG